MANSPTSAKEWKKKSAGEPLELPSGNTALVKRPGMEALFTAGVLPDELTKMALEQVQRAESGGRPMDRQPKGGSNALDSATLEKFLQGENALTDVFEAFDRITEFCVIEPKATFHKRMMRDSGGSPVERNGKVEWEVIPDEDRDEEVLYTDEVDLEDKMFIFNYVVGGSRDLETFRSEFGDALATVEPREDVDVSS